MNNGFYQGSGNNEQDNPSVVAVIGLPIGTIIEFGGAAAPANYLLCGTAVTNVSRITYAALFLAIGTLWGVGDGSTTFGIPFFPADYAAIQAAGNVGTQSAGAVISHTHGLSDGSAIQSTAAGAAYGSTATGGSSANIAAAGGAANYPAGSRVLRCVKYQ